LQLAADKSKVIDWKKCHVADAALAPANAAQGNKKAAFQRLSR
jgi:hypothetical protein